MKVFIGRPPKVIVKERPLAPKNPSRRGCSGGTPPRIFENFWKFFRSKCLKTPQKCRKSYLIPIKTSKKNFEKMSFQKYITFAQPAGGTPPAVIPPPAVAIFPQKSKNFACSTLLGLKIGTKILQKDTTG